MMARPKGEGGVRLGIAEDFAAYRLTELLASFMRSRPGLRLDVRTDQSTYLRRDLERSELDLALLKRPAGEKGGISVWPERIHWVTSKTHPVNPDSHSVPLIGFPPAACTGWAPFTPSKAQAAPGTWPTPVRASRASRPRSLPDWA